MKPKPPNTSDSVLVQSIMGAIAQRDAQKAAGASDAELDANLEATLRACWPVTREWKYLCETCGDTGWRVQTCPADPCLRDRPHLPHEYVTPCWCAKGQHQRAKPAEDTVLNNAADTTTRRRPTRIGRREE